MPRAQKSFPIPLLPVELLCYFIKSIFIFLCLPLLSQNDKVILMSLDVSLPNPPILSLISLNWCQDLDF